MKRHDPVMLQWTKDFIERMLGRRPACLINHIRTKQQNRRYCTCDSLLQAEPHTPSGYATTCLFYDATAVS
jgi:hypothetical protein